MPSQLETGILKTVVYFDLFSYPLTALEVWRNLGTEAQYRDVVRAFQESEWLKERVEFSGGMWNLRSPLGGERPRRYRVSKHKMDIARRFARFARLVPWVRAIYACNSLGFLHARPESDIDLFVVTRRGRIWSARFFLVLIAKLFFRRPTGAQVKDAICLSFFATEGAGMKKVALPGGDVYYEHWLKNLVLLTPHPNPSPLGRGPGEGGGGSRLMEKVLKAVQLRIMPAHLKAMANKGTSVMLTDEFLKFHDHDRREYFRQEFESRFAQVAG